MVELDRPRVGHAGRLGERVDRRRLVLEEGDGLLGADLEEVVPERVVAEVGDQPGTEHAVVEADGRVHVGGDQCEVVDAPPAACSAIMPDVPPGSQSDVTAARTPSWNAAGSERRGEDARGRRPRSPGGGCCCTLRFDCDSRATASRSSIVTPHSPSRTAARAARRARRSRRAGSSGAPMASPRRRSSSGTALGVEPHRVREDHRVGQPVRDARCDRPPAATSPWCTPIEPFCRQRPAERRALEHRRARRRRRPGRRRRAAAPARSGARRPGRSPRPPACGAASTRPRRSARARSCRSRR